MNSELNNYKINNPDGTSKEKYTERKMSYSNDKSRYIKEDPVADQEETSKAAETFDDSTRLSYDTPVNGNNITNASSSESSVSAMSSTKGGVSALVGAVAATAMTAAIVVAAFVSTLVVNLSLVMATMSSLVLKVDFTGAREEDFINPMFAVLESVEEFYFEQEISPDSTYLIFNNLEPDREYVITIKNEEKVFVKKSYYTANERTEECFISAWIEEDEVTVFVEMTDSKLGELYTVTAKDNKGNVVFVKDDIEPSGEFYFRLTEPKTLYITLTVGGKVYAFTQIEAEFEPDPTSHP